MNIANGTRVKFTVVGEWNSGNIYPDGGGLFEFIEAVIVDLGSVEVLPDPIKPGDYFVSKDTYNRDVWLAVDGGYVRLTNGGSMVYKTDLDSLGKLSKAISFEEANAIITDKTAGMDIEF